MMTTRAKRTDRRRWLIAMGVGLVLSSGSPSGLQAAISEPEHRFYGQVTANGAVVLDADVRLHRDGCGSELLARSTPGDLDGANDFYVLIVPLEFLIGNEAPSVGVARVGDMGTLCVTADDESGSPKTTALQKLYIGDRGLAVRVDLDISNAAADPPGGADLDADSIPDFADNCAISNPSQADGNGNGIGDLCESLVNRPVAESLTEVGGVSNPPDSNGVGGVDYVFDVASLEVTNAQYMEFLLAVAAVEDPHGLYNPLMASDPRGGIVRQGEPASYAYSAKPNMADKPVNFVSWVDAASFANWMHNGQPVGSLAASRTGAFDLTVADPGLNAAMQNAGWSLPTEHEWYKAAYYDPQRGGVPYWLYPTRDDIDPLPATANAVGEVTNPAANVVNYGLSADWNGQDGNLVSVGSATAASFYNARDMAGNVAEWLGEDAAVTGQRRIRGGSYRDGISALASSAGDADTLRDPAYEGADVGFRVLQVPEPGGLLQPAAALLVFATLAWRRRR